MSGDVVVFSDNGGPAVFSSSGNVAVGEGGLAQSPGAKGDPGGNVMSVGLFTDLGGINVPLGTEVIQTSGWDRPGVGLGQYVADATLSDADVAAHPRAIKVTANGRKFRLLGAFAMFVSPFMFGAVDCTGLPKLSTEVVSDNKPQLDAMGAYVKFRAKNHNEMLAMDLSGAMGLGVDGTWTLDTEIDEAIWNRATFPIIGGRLVAMSPVENLLELTNGNYELSGQMELYGGTDTQLNSGHFGQLLMNYGLKVKNVAGSRLGDIFVQGAKRGPISYDHQYLGNNNNIPTQWGRVIGIQCGTRTSYIDALQGTYSAGSYRNVPADNGNVNQRHRFTITLAAGVDTGVVRAGDAISAGDYTTSDTAGKRVGIVQEIIGVVGQAVTLEVSPYLPIQTGGQWQLMIGGCDIWGPNLANNTFEMIEMYAGGGGIRCAALFAPKIGSLLTESTLCSIQCGGVTSGDASQGLVIEHYHLESVQWALVDYGSNNPIKLKVQSSWPGWDKVIRLSGNAYVGGAFVDSWPVSLLGIDIEVTGGVIHMPTGVSAKGRDLGGLTNHGGLGMGNEPQTQQFETIYTPSGFSISLIAEKALANIAVKHRRVRFRIYGDGPGGAPTSRVDISRVYYQPEVTVNDGAGPVNIDPVAPGMIDVEAVYEPPANNGTNGNWRVFWARVASDYVAPVGGGAVGTTSRLRKIPYGDLVAAVAPIVYYDVQRIDHLWQDTAGAVAAAVGSPVARIDDLSGHGWHLTQGTSGSRAILRKYGQTYFLEFDGVDDYYSSVGNPFDPAFALPFTALVGAILDDSVAQHTLFCGIFSINSLRVEFGGAPQFAAYSTDPLAGGTPDTEFHVYGLEAAAHAANILIDGDIAVSGDAGNTNWAGGLNVGASNGPTAFIRGLWTGMVIYSGVDATKTDRSSARMLADASI